MDGPTHLQFARDGLIDILTQVRAKEKILALRLTGLGPGTDLMNPESMNQATAALSRYLLFLEIIASLEDKTELDHIKERMEYYRVENNASKKRKS